MTCSHVCPESFTRPTHNSTRFVAQDTRLWAPAAQSKGMWKQERTTCENRNRDHAVKSHQCYLVRFSWQMVRRWPVKPSWKQWWWPRMHPQMGGLERVTGRLGIRTLDCLVQTWEVWAKEDMQLNLALEWNVIGERTGVDPRWRYKDSRMIATCKTRPWGSVWMRRAACAQCSAWPSLRRTIGWRWEFQWPRQMGMG